MFETVRLTRELLKDLDVYHHVGIMKKYYGRQVRIDFERSIIFTGNETSYADFPDSWFELFINEHWYHGNIQVVGANDRDGDSGRFDYIKVTLTILEDAQVRRVTEPWNESQLEALIREIYPFYNGNGRFKLSFTKTITKLDKNRYV